jgi:spermidine/putrescine transport system permease protein
MNRIIKNCYTATVYFFLYLPIVIVVGYSFNDSKRSLLWHGFTTRWYHDLIHETGLMLVAWHSLVIALLAATCATILGTLLSTAIYKYRFTGRQFLSSMTYLLIVAPDIVLAIALLMLYNVVHMPLGFWSLLLAHVTFCLPFVTIMVNTKFRGFDKNIVEAAKDLGANDSTIFFKIMLPILMPALLAGWLISFTLSLDDVMISFFVTGPGFEILPLKIYSLARLGVSPELNALCTVMLVVTLCTVLLSQLLFGRKE